MKRNSWDEVPQGVRRGGTTHYSASTVVAGGSIPTPLMPWTVSAVFMAVTLGVPTLSYAPWAVFCYGGPFFLLLIAALYPRTRFGIRPRTSDGTVG